MTTALQGPEFDVRTTKPTVEVVLSQAHLADRAAIQQLVDRIMREVEDWQLEHRPLIPDGVVKHLHVVAHALHDDATAGTESIVLREEIDKTSMFEEIVGTSLPLRTVLSLVSKVAPTDSTVLITGETGTGKELIARAIHKRSPRSTTPLSRPASSCRTRTINVRYSPRSSVGSMPSLLSPMSCLVPHNGCTRRAIPGSCPGAWKMA